jgi:hypothetical protein
MVNRVISHQKATGISPKRIAVKVELDDVTPLHRAELPPVAPRGKSPIEDHIDRAHKRSRYMTLPDEIDKALGLINRELEQACQSKAAFVEMKRKLDIVEQELKIQRGKTELLERDRRRIEALDGMDVGIRDENRQLREQNTALVAEMKAKMDEWERWKVSMKAFVDGK